MVELKSESPNVGVEFPAALVIVAVVSVFPTWSIRVTVEPETKLVPVIVNTSLAVSK